MSDMCTYTTGAKKKAATGKGRYDLISPIAMQYLANRLEYGADEHGDRNWEKGLPLSRIVDSMKRHIDQWVMGCEDEDHMGAFLCNAMFAVHTYDQICNGYLPAHLCDIPGLQGRISTEAPTTTPEQRVIYVSGPYTASSENARVANTVVAGFIGKELAETDHCVYVPHTMTHPYVSYFDHDDFMELDKPFMNMAGAIFRQGPSTGSDEELRWACAMDIPVMYSLAEVCPWYVGHQKLETLMAEAMRRLENYMSEQEPEVSHEVRGIVRMWYHSGKLYRRLFGSDAESIAIVKEYGKPGGITERSVRDATGPEFGDDDAPGCKSESGPGVHGTECDGDSEHRGERVAGCTGAGVTGPEPEAL
jgi:hypothetical protein